MNVEFQIHGVLSSGQARWKQEDKDYYSQFYSGQSVDTLMIVEIVNRPHGISAYYNYLRNNNILSEREGSYFGMTVRIDGAFCKDVKSLYMILDNLFNKMIIGNILIQKNNGKYEYSIDSFSTHHDYLSKVEAQFSNMFNAFFSPQDFFDISTDYASQGSKLSINASDITTSTAVEAVKQRAKLYLSPEYQPKFAQQKIDEANAKVKAAQDDAKARIEAAEQNHNKSRIQRESELESWRKEKVALETARDKAIKDYQELERKARTADLNKSISEKIAEIKIPIIQLAGLMASRFPENGKEKSENIISPVKKKHQDSKLSVWAPWGICGVLAIILAFVLWNMEGSKAPSNSDIIDKQANEIRQLRDSIIKITAPAGANIQSEEMVGGAFDTEKNASLNNDYSKLRVDINELKTGEKVLKAGNTYHFSITGGKFPEGGHWIVSEGNNIIKENQLTVTAPNGTLVTITYYYGQDVVATRQISIN